MSFQNSQLEFENMKSDVQIEINSFLKNESKTFINDKDILIKIDNITNQTIENLKLWMSENIPDKYKKIILKNIYDKNWSEIIEAFKQELTFGTSGIRGKLISSIDEKKSDLDLKNLKDFEFESDILRGPNTINEITLLKNITPVALNINKNTKNKHNKTHNLNSKLERPDVRSFTN